MIDLEATRKKMAQAIEFLVGEIGTLKTGRATPDLVARIMVEAYETRMPLVELATITTSEANQLVVTPFDQSVIKQIEKSLSQDRDLGISPRIDGQLIRLDIPPLTGERREEFVKLLNQKIEAGRVTLRQIRQEVRAEIKSLFENSQLSEDEKFRLEEKLQELADEFMEKIDQIGKNKEKELLTT
ncbi:MAG TPA: ribosome recycling factor [Candidatus Bathyarchaeia archaeon]|nr:ribosome recycling factor [Candidatus Bathyarchaeia archaeon]